MSQVERTSNAKNCTFPEFCRDGILDFSIGLVVHGCYLECKLLRHEEVHKIIPVASSRMRIFVSWTSARANDTNDRWVVINNQKRRREDRRKLYLADRQVIATILDWSIQVETTAGGLGMTLSSCLIGRGPFLICVDEVRPPKSVPKAGIIVQTKRI